MSNPTGDMHRFTLEDRWGETHAYDMTYTPGTEGIGISMYFAGSTSVPIARAIGQVTKAKTLVSWYLGIDDDTDTDKEAEAYDTDASGEVGSVADINGNPEHDQAKGATERKIDTDTLIQSLQELEIAEFGMDLQTLMCDPKAPSLIIRILRHTIRDNKDLGVERNFDEAFRGNYMEAGKAALEVIKANGFLPLPDISGLAEGLLGA